mgnify:CR=1 FL=1
MLEEKDYYAALEVEQSGEKAQEAAEPVEAQTAGEISQPPAGEQAQEVAEPAQTSQPETMSLQERRQNAAARRKREMEAAVEQAREEEREKFRQREKEFFARAGLRDSNGEKKLESFDDFEQWYQGRKRQELERNLKAGRLTPENLQQALQSLPVMQQAQTLVKQIEQQKRQQQQAQFQKQVDEELQQIHRLDPSVKDLEDILQMDTAEAFNRYVREKGLSYLEAFKLANADRLSQRRAEQEKQRTLQAVASKRHLAPTGGAAADTVRVPREVADLFRAMNPEMSAQDIQREYKKWYRQSP